MKIYCKGGPNTLTKGRIYDVISGSFEDGGFLIKDNFDNTQWYYSEYFLSIKDGRDILLDTILNETTERKNIED